MVEHAEAFGGPHDGAAVEHPAPIRRPVMAHRWDRLSFIHWPYPPALVQRLLPEGLEVDTFEDAAWVGIVPFLLGVRLPAWAPTVPVLSRFVEVNVRTYVRGPGGLTGIWFLSLEAPHLLPLLVARGWYRIPYAWARMRFTDMAGPVAYETRRRWPRHARPSATIIVEPGEELSPAESSELDGFLTARFRLWSPAGKSLARTEVDHPPWRLRRARLLHLREDLLEAAGLPPATGEPVVRFSRAMAVAFGPRTIVEPIPPGSGGRQLRAAPPAGHGGGLLERRR